VTEDYRSDKDLYYFAVFLRDCIMSKRTFWHKEIL